MIVYSGTNASIVKFTELYNAYYNSCFGMNPGDFLKVDRMKDRYLGHDVVLENYGEEFINLPSEEQEKMNKERDFGKYGVIHHARKDETSIALHVLLAITAREIIQNETIAEDPFIQDDILRETEVEPELITLYQDNDLVSKILETFPDGKITKEHFAALTTPYPAPKLIGEIPPNHLKVN
jgi:hypothetical protein